MSSVLKKAHRVRHNPQNKMQIGNRDEIAGLVAATYGPRVSLIRRLTMALLVHQCRRDDSLSAKTGSFSPVGK